MGIRASASVCEITPDTSLPLAGYCERARLSTGSLTPLQACAVHIRGGSGGIIALSLDVQHLAPSLSKQIRAKVSAATGTREDNIFVCATGCSSAPYAEHAVYLRNAASYARPDEDYSNMLVAQSVKAASEAAVSTRPVSIAAVNFDTPGTGAIILKAENGRAIAAIICTDDTPDFMGNNNTLLSSDFVGYLRETLSAKFGGEPVVVFIPGPSGERLLEDRPAFGADEAKRAGQNIASLLISKLKVLRGSDFSSEIAVDGSISEIYSVPKIDIPPLQNASALLGAASKMNMSESQSDNPAQRIFSKWALIEANRTMSAAMAKEEGMLSESLNEYDPVLIQSLNIGPVSIIGVPCLMLGKCARHILQSAPPGTWLAQAVNGNMIGSLLSCNQEDGIRGRLLSPVFDRNAAQPIIAEILRQGILRP